MMRSLFSGVAGMRNNQVRMDVIGNNIANVNTVAFKASRVTFKEGFAQMLQAANRPNNGIGGSNPMQVGSGADVASIDAQFTQGTIQASSNPTDLAIQGDSFFVVAKNGEKAFTRAGAFQFDANSSLVQPGTGMIVQGRLATNGVIGGPITDIRVSPDLKSAALATTSIRIAGNLDASAAIVTGDTPANRASDPSSFRDTSIDVFDSMGAQHQIKVTMYKSALNQWTWSVDPNALGPDGTTLAASTGTISFDAVGNQTNGALPAFTFTPSNGSNAMSVSLDIGTGLSGLTQYAGTASAIAHDQDGYTSGTLSGVTIDRSGTVMGSFTNGTVQAVAQIALASFSNPAGLERTGDNVFAPSSNSGEAIIGFSGDGSNSTMQSGALEMSNVDLAQQFTDMIVAQRGFQASSKIITTADELLQEVVNLRR